MSEKYFCQDCQWRGAMSQAEWMQHLSMFPTHMPVMEDEERDFKDLVKS